MGYCLSFYYPGSKHQNFLMTSVRYLLLLLSFELLYVECRTGDDNFTNALRFLNELRECAIQSEYRGIKLPELTSYASASTLNDTVNIVVEKEYFRFWQEVRRWDYEQDRKRLHVLSKGAALAFLKSPTIINPHCAGGLSGVVESAFLLPLLKGNLPRYRLKCIAAKDASLLDSLEAMIGTSTEYSGLERELVLTAVHLLSVVVVISKCSWEYVSEEEKSALRSDDRALECIRDWDRGSTSLKILYLKFLLHARQLIAHISNNKEELKMVPAMQGELYQLIQTEFSSNIMWEVGRNVNGPYAINLSTNGTASKGSVYEVHLLFARDSPKYIKAAKNLNYQKSVGNVGNLFLENHKLYISVGEFYGNNHTGGVDSLLSKLMRDMSMKDFIMRENPASFYLN